MHRRRIPSSPKRVRSVSKNSSNAKPTKSPSSTTKCTAWRTCEDVHHVQDKGFVDDASKPKSFAAGIGLSGSEVFRARCFRLRNDSKTNAMGTRVWRLGCDCEGLRRRNGAMVTRSLVSRLWAALAGASIAKCFDSGAVRRGSNSRCSIGEIRRFS